MLATRVGADLVKPVLRRPVAGIAGGQLIEDGAVDLPPRWGGISHQGHGIAGLDKIEPMPRPRRFAADAVPVLVGSAVLVPVVGHRCFVVEITQLAATTVRYCGVVSHGLRHSMPPLYVSI